jgi:glycosyltransferase involved in cell wall biosynthesis
MNVGQHNQRNGIQMSSTHRPVSTHTPRSISCVICAYNEADKIARILTAVVGHPLFADVVVVNDGSTDDTAALAQSFPGVTLISYPANRGKTYALSQGIAAAQGDHIMLIDADLAGLTAADIFALAEPVTTGRAQVSISLRANSLALYRALGLDFVSGERLIPAWLVRPYIAEMERLPRWGGEAFINNLITRAGLPIAVVDWPGVFNIRKAEKVGALRGFLAELAMTVDVFRVLTPVKVVGQNLAMLSLIQRPKTNRNVWLRFGTPVSDGFRALLSGRRPAA